MGALEVRHHSQAFFSSELSASSQTNHLLCPGLFVFEVSWGSMWSRLQFAELLPPRRELSSTNSPLKHYPSAQCRVMNEAQCDNVNECSWNCQLFEGVAEVAAAGYCLGIHNQLLDIATEYRIGPPSHQDSY